MGSRQPIRREHTRRPPLAEMDSWELWQAWRRGERKRVMPWFVLLAGFSLVLGAMYSFFYFSTVLSEDDIFPIILGLAYMGFLYWLWQRISPHRLFALGIVFAMVIVSTIGFVAWFLLYLVTDFNPLVAILGTAVLGLVGLFVGLRALNAIEQQQGKS